MFFWKHEDFNLALSDQEEKDFLKQVTSTPEERIRYHTNREVRRKLERLIFRRLEELYELDKNTFIDKFVLREGHREDALILFPLLLAGYSNFNGRAALGSYEEEVRQMQLRTENPMFDMFLNNQKKEFPPKYFKITLFEKQKWLASRPTVSSYVSIPSSSIVSIYGTVDKFELRSQESLIEFTENHVSISIRDSKD